MARVSKTQIAIAVLALIGYSQAYITGCQTYVTPVPVTGETCATCGTGFTLANGGKECNTCPIGCTQCDAANNCVKCSLGSFPYKGECMSCITGCEVCSTTSNSCTKCARTFTLNNGQCLACIENCESCTQAGVCTKCKNMYLLTKNTLGQERCVYNDYIGNSPGIVVWIVVLFLLCCAPLALLCFFMFKPKHIDEGDHHAPAYAPLTQQTPKNTPPPATQTSAAGSPRLPQTSPVTQPNVNTYASPRQQLPTHTQGSPVNFQGSPTYNQGYTSSNFNPLMGSFN